MMKIIRYWKAFLGVAVIIIGCWLPSELFYVESCTTWQPYLPVQIFLIAKISAIISGILIVIWDTAYHNFPGA